VANFIFDDNEFDAKNQQTHKRSKLSIANVSH
jgi:hypothetical protein